MDFIDPEVISDIVAGSLLRERIEAWLDSIEMASCPPFDGKSIPLGWFPPEEDFEDDEIDGKEYFDAREHPEDN